MNDYSNQSDRVAVYKELLHGYLARLPSGFRKKIADAIGTNRSFVSQITNPKYSVPIPSHYVHKIIAVCHLPPSERAEFLAAYVDAHPGQAELLASSTLLDADTITIDLSAVKDEAQRNLIKQTLKYTAESLIVLSSGKAGDRN